MKKILYLLSLTVLLCACVKEIATVQSRSNQLNIDVRTMTFTGGQNEGPSAIRSLEAYLFVDEVLAGIYPGLNVDSKRVELPAVFFEGATSSLYLIANRESVNGGLSDPAQVVIGTTREEDFPIAFSGSKSVELSSIPQVAKRNLTGLDLSLPIELKLSHAFARLDLKVDADQVEITSLQLKNLPNEGLLLAPDAPEGAYRGELYDQRFDYTDKPLTDSRVIGYINEGRGLNIPVEIKGRFNGIDMKISATLPASITRNMVYTVRVVKVGVTLTADIQVADWEDGGTTDATPDVMSRVLVDPLRSQLPADCRLSETRDTLYLPSSKDNNLLVAFAADYAIEASIQGNSAALSISPEGADNLFRLQVAGHRPGSPAYYSYVKLKNKFFEDYYGERLVLAVASNYDVPLIDVAPLGTLAGVTVTNAQAVLDSPYGGDQITITPDKLQLGGTPFAAINSLQLLPGNPDFRALRLTLRDNKILIESLANISGLSQGVTYIVSGTSADGTPVAGQLSFLAPAVPADDVAAIDAQCVEMGGNQWLHFNASGSYKSDVANAKAIAALGVLSAETIRKNYSKFGLSYLSSQAVRYCPAGYISPTMPQMLELFGLEGTTNLDEAKKRIALLNDVKTNGSVTTPGGMTIDSYTLFSETAPQGQAVIAIHKDGRTLWLPNGRIVLLPNYHFDFWRSGIFNIFSEASAMHSRRCIKDLNFKGYN